MCDCRSLRVAQLVNLGLGDAWVRALVAALPRMDNLRILDLSHNLVGVEGATALTATLPTNHSLLWLQLLPQWLPLPSGVEGELQGVLSRRRIKVELNVQAATAVYSSRGDAGEPMAQFEWEGVRHSTAAAASGLNAVWEERFTFLIPGVLLWPPSRLPLHLFVLDARPRAQRNADPPMGTAELPLGSLLLADALSVTCSLALDPGAAPIEAPPGELLLELSALHVGMPHPDDLSPGVPLARIHAMLEQRRAEFRAATAMQTRWRSRTAKGERARREQGQGSRPDLASVVQRAAEASAGGYLCLALHQCCRFNPLHRCLRLFPLP